MKLNASDRVYLHLVSQRGDLEHLARFRSEWMRAYWAECNATVAQLIRGGWSPSQVLDIGSGCGGVDIVLMKLFGCQCCLVDGLDGGPAPQHHHLPFGNFSITRMFMRENDIRDDEWIYVAPEQLLRDTANKWDTVISTRSWCFHYEPGAYLGFVLDHLAPSGKVLLDVRKDKPEWFAELANALKPLLVVQQSEKFDRWVFERPCP